MLTHQYHKPHLPTRVVVLGAGGFIGGAIASRLKSEGINTLPITRLEIDLLSSQASDKLASLLDPQDVLVFVSAKAPCKDIAMLLDNTHMAQSVCAALQKTSVAHVVYISSDAVYKDSSGSLTEAACAEPSALHGVMHLTREIALKQVYLGPLAIVRPTLVYGYDDPHNGYGPNRFSRLAANGEDILLFGEGEELRDHVDVNDIAELVRLIVVHKSVGIANAVSGEVVSFRQLAEHAVASYASKSQIKGTKRNGPMPHNGYRSFDNAAVLKAFPSFSFKTWSEGLTAVYKQQSAEQEK
jgi:nucleoside-diphosphate-sugar epimerase